MDTSNKFMLGVLGNDIVPIIHGRIPPRMSKEDALLLAAWLVALAEVLEPAELKFEDVLKAVRSGE